MNQAHLSDEAIVELYWLRDERAITATDEKYGALCRSISSALLNDREASEECLNDCYHCAWNSMPDSRPRYLKSWLCRVIRNISIDRYRRTQAKKRYAGIELMLDELDECLPADKTIDDELEAKQLGTIIEAWLRELDEDSRKLFIRRYFYGEALNKLALEYGIEPSRLAQRMHKLRLKLKARLETEDIFL